MQVRTACSYYVYREKSPASPGRGLMTAGSSCAQGKLDRRLKRSGTSGFDRRHNACVVCLLTKASFYFYFFYLWSCINLANVPDGWLCRLRRLLNLSVVDVRHGRIPGRPQAETGAKLQCNASPDQIRPVPPRTIIRHGRNRSFFFHDQGTAGKWPEGVHSR